LIIVGQLVTDDVIMVNHLSLKKTAFEDK